MGGDRGGEGEGGGGEGGGGGGGGEGEGEEDEPQEWVGGRNSTSWECSSSSWRRRRWVDGFWGRFCQPQIFLQEVTQT